MSIQCIYKACTSPPASSVIKYSKNTTGYFYWRLSLIFTSTHLHRISLLGQESQCFDQTLGTAPPTTDLQETHTYIETYSQWLSLQTHDNTYPVSHSLTSTMYPTVFRQFHGVNGNIPHMRQSWILERCWIILEQAWASNKLHLECPQACSYRPARLLWLQGHGLSFTVKPWASRGIHAMYALSRDCQTRSIVQK